MAISGAFTNANTTATPVTFHLDVQADNGCTTNNISATVLVDAPLAPITISSTQIICDSRITPGVPTPLTSTVPTGGSSSGYTYQWYLSKNSDSGPWTPITGATSATYLPPNPGDDNDFYQLIVTNSCGTVTSNIVQISTAKNIAGAGLLNGVPSTLCSGEGFHVDLISGTVRGAILGQKYMRFVWQNQDAGFFSNTDAPVIPENTPFGETQHFILYWFTGSANFAAHNTTNTPLDKTLIIIPTVYNQGGSIYCATEPINITMTINPVPVITGKFATVCSGDNFSVIPKNGTPSGNIVPSNTTYTWDAPTGTGFSGGLGGSGTSITGTLSTTTNASATAIYTVTPTSPTGSCAGNSFTVTVTVNPKPVIADAATTICSGSSFTVTPADGNPSGNVVPMGTTYSWSKPIVADITGLAAGTDQTNISGTLGNSTNKPIDVTYNVTATSGSCGGANFNVTVTVNPTPTSTISAVDHVVCSGTGTTINFSGTPNATISYTVNGTPATVTLDNTGAATVPYRKINNGNNLRLDRSHFCNLY